MHHSLAALKNICLLGNRTSLPHANKLIRKNAPGHPVKYPWQRALPVFDFPSQFAFFVLFLKVCPAAATRGVKSRRARHLEKTVCMHRVTPFSPGDSASLSHSLDCTHKFSFIGESERVYVSVCKREEESETDRGRQGERER